MSFCAVPYSGDEELDAKNIDCQNARFDMHPEITMASAPTTSSNQWMARAAKLTYNNNDSSNVLASLEFEVGTTFSSIDTRGKRASCYEGRIVDYMLWWGAYDTGKYEDTIFHHEENVDSIYSASGSITMPKFK